VVAATPARPPEDAQKLYAGDITDKMLQLAVVWLGVGGMGIFIK
jgi:hypothetical protein